MKINIIQNLDNFSGTILIPIFETDEKNEVNITFDGLEIPVKLFSGIKDTHYLAEKNNNIYLFIGLGKTIDYKALKTIFRRISAKQKEHFNLKR